MSIHRPTGGSPVTADYTCPNGCVGHWALTGWFHAGYTRSRYEPEEESHCTWDGEPPTREGEHAPTCALSVEQEAEMSRYFENDFVHEYLDALHYEYDPSREEEWYE